MQALRTVYRYWSALLFLAVLVQIGASGYGAFYAAAKTNDKKTLNEDQFTHGFDFHNGLGYVIFLGTIVLLLLALGARLGKRRVLIALAAAVLLIVQILLAWAGEDHPVVGIFHPVNAFLIVGLVGRIAYAAWWGERTPAVAQATPAP